MTGTHPMPKAAQQFIDDAKAAGFKVTVVQDSSGLFISVKRGETSGTAVWAETVVYDNPLRNERLGFRTSGGKDAFRFSYGETYSPYRGHGSHRSLRQVRGHIGLVI